MVSPLIHLSSSILLTKGEKSDREGANNVSMNCYAMCYLHHKTEAASTRVPNSAVRALIMLRISSDDSLVPFKLLTNDYTPGQMFLCCVLLPQLLCCVNIVVDKDTKKCL